MNDNLLIRRRKIKIDSLQRNRQLDLLLSFTWYDSEEGEAWKQVRGYEEYFISNHGRVLSLKCGGYKLLQPFTIDGGYLGIDLRQGGIRHIYRVHRLVAEAFIDNPDNKQFCHHKDRNRKNNRVDNLLWVSQQEHDEIHKDLEAADRKENKGDNDNERKR